MQYRFMKITDSSYPEVSFGTFHSIYYQIIRNSNICKNSNLTLVNGSFKYEMIRDILSLLKSQGKINSDEYQDSIESISDIISEISRIKNTGGNPADVSNSLVFKRYFYSIFELYKMRLAEFSKIDFDDMIIKCYEILSADRNILDFWREKFRFILIDEYQDINPMQYRVIKLLSEGRDNVFAVGDDDQSIYGFRGSDPGIMLDFPKSFGDKEVKVINLNINYRCCKRILDNSLMVIGDNKERFVKELNEGPGVGNGSVVARRYESRQKQYEQIALFLKKHEDELSNIAILFRTNSEAMALSTVLCSYGIPNNLEAGNGAIYENEAVKLCLDYLSFAYEGHKRSDFFKIMNHPVRYISRDSALKDLVTEREVSEYYRGNQERLKSVKELFRHLNMIEHLRPSLSVRYIRRTIGIDKLYPGSMDVLDEFEKEASNYENTIKMLMEIRERADFEKDRVKELRAKASRGNVVKLLTMHAAKGLEFDMVWLPDLNEGIIPSRNATTDKETEEERRMLYVAMTRAKKALIMSYITGTKENPMLPTRFIRPIKGLWDEIYNKTQTSSEPSSGRSTSSSNSASSR
jgi:DNA helicase-2/ATP-dependent DNA helicase PcrA